MRRRRNPYSCLPLHLPFSFSLSHLPPILYHPERPGAQDYALSGTRRTRRRRRRQTQTDSAQRVAGGGRRMPRVFTGFQRASFNLFRLWPSAFGRSDRPFTRLMILGPQSRNHNFPCKPIRQRTLLTFRNLYDNEFMRSIVPLLSFGALHVCSGWVMFLGLWRPWKWWASRRRISEITKRSQCT